MELGTACRCSCALQEVERLLVMRMGITMTRYDVYYVHLHCANHADLGDNLDMTSLPSKHVRRRSNTK